MAFAQLTYRESLRDIETCLAAQSAKLYHMGFREPVRRATLADANEARDWRIHADLAQRLMAVHRAADAGRATDCRRGGGGGVTAASREPGAGSGLVVAAQILEWKDQIWDFWCGVAGALEAQGQQLVLLSPWTPPCRAEWPVVLPMPYAIGEFAPDAHASMTRDPAWD